MIALVLVIMVAVLLVVFKVIDSIATKKNGNIVTILNSHNECIEDIKNTDDEANKREKIDIWMELKYITQEEANELY